MNESRRTFLGFLGLALLPVKIKALGRLFGKSEPEAQSWNPQFFIRCEAEGFQAVHEFQIFRDGERLEVRFDGHPCGLSWENAIHSDRPKTFVARAGNAFGRITLSPPLYNPQNPPTKTGVNIHSVECYEILDTRQPVRMDESAWSNRACLPEFHPLPYPEA